MDVPTFTIYRQEISFTCNQYDFTASLSSGYANITDTVGSCEGYKDCPETFKTLNQLVKFVEMWIESALAKWATLERLANIVEKMAECSHHRNLINKQSGTPATLHHSCATPS